MSFEEKLTAGGSRYATLALAEEARVRLAAAAQESAERERRRSESWERAIRDRYLATPGASMESWNRDRDAILRDERFRAMENADTAARVANQQRYGR